MNSPFKNRIVREETCFRCGKQIAVFEYVAYNADDYIRITVKNGIVIQKVSVCHPCFNAYSPIFTDTYGWFHDAQAYRAEIKFACYLMREKQQQVTDADGWHYLKDAQEYLWKQIETEVL